ncbi:NAD(P)H-hydrate epimerase [bacterium]
MVYKKSSQGKILSANEMKVFDDWAINNLGIPGMILMENAGREVAEYIYKNYFTKKSSYEQVTIFCGLGNNGGDGLVAARHLLIRGVKVRVYIVGGVSGLSADAELNFRILRKIGMVVTPILTEKEIGKIKLGKKDIVIDGIFGIGLNREIDGINKEIIDHINLVAAPVISIDVPSGLNANSGDDWGTCIKASTTITFSFLKKGFFLKRGKEVSGKVEVVDIGAFKKKYKVVE